MTKRTTLSHRRHILEKENGTISKVWGGKIPICLVFPNTYHVGMSNLGFQLLYRHLNSLPDVVCERAFLPDRGEWEEYLRSDTPLLSLESSRPLTQFQIVAFSLPFENDFDVNKDTIAADVISKVGPGGHFLAERHTAQRARKEFFFPVIADRQTREAWAAAGSVDAAQRARSEAKRILAEHRPTGFADDLEKLLRDKYRGISG